MWDSPDVTLRVNPETLFAKAREGAQVLTRMRRSLAEMDRLVSGSSGYWRGEAGDTYRSSYEQYKQEAQRICQRLQEHVDELQPMGDTYRQAEQAAQDLVETLSSDVII